MSEEAQSQQQDINTADTHHPRSMSIDELLEVIQGANGMPVLFVPDSNGRLAAVAVHGLQNMLPTDRDDNESPAGNRQQDFRAWLLLLTSLVATVTYTAGLAPPGGFWAADDKENGYVAGTSVMSDMFPVRYKLFHYSITTAFFSSLMLIEMLAQNVQVQSSFFIAFAGVCFVSLGTSYITGTWDSRNRAPYDIFLFVFLIFHIPMQWFLGSHIEAIVMQPFARLMRRSGFSV